MIKLDESYADKLKNKKFIDLFCGLGGFRLALESYGAKCVFSSDIDKHVSKTYENNFGTYPLSDITKVAEKDIPSHDILCAGFPCQAFSISGKQMGFEDTRGTLFREVVRIAKYHKPELLLLENVKNLEKHDNGRTFNVIKENIEHIGYNMYHQVINASQYGVPQARERIYMVCIRKDLDNGNYVFPKPLKNNKCVKDILLNSNEVEEYIISKPFQFEVLHGYKTDVQVQVTIKLKKIIDAQNLQIKLVSNEKGFNQIDKRWIKNYKEMWNIPENIVELLKYYTGENKPYRNSTKDVRRMFMNEFTEDEQMKILDFFEQNKMLIILDIVKGRGKFAAEWILVAQKYEKIFR